MKRGPIFPPPSPRLFSDSHPAAPPAGVHVANIDGASRGNPGPAAYAVVLRDPEGKVILELAKKLGRETNNVAEYYGLLAALDYAAAHGIRALCVRSDSELLVRQVQGRYKVKSTELKPLHERAVKLARQLEYFAIEHVRREQNREADGLANLALDQAGVPKFETRSGGGGAGGNSGAAGNAPRGSQAAAVTVRAHYVKGVLVPVDPLDLPEGAEVAFQLRVPPK